MTKTIEIPTLDFEKVERIPLTIARMIVKLQEIENQELNVVSFRNGEFVPLTEEELFTTFREVYLDEDGKNGVLCLNTQQIPVSTVDGQEEYDGDYDILPEIDWITDALESMGIITNDLIPETDIHVVTALDSLSSFALHKSKALHHISHARKEIMIMGDVVIADEDLNTECPGCENCEPPIEVGTLTQDSEEITS